MSSEEAKVTIAAKKSPSDFLKQVLGRPVVVKSNTGVEYRGILACLDGFMNIAMEQTEGCYSLVNKLFISFFNIYLLKNTKITSLKIGMETVLFEEIMVIIHFVVIFFCLFAYFIFIL